MFGTVAVLYGFGVYYLLPLSLLSFNFSLAMTVFLFILFGMIFALATMVINFLPYVNAVVASVLLFFEKKSVRIVVSKNLIAHKERNQMTALMFSLTLGFIIFLNIVCRIPFYKDFNDVAKSVGHQSITLTRSNQPQD
jgi:hypothetical protein